MEKRHLNRISDEVWEVPRSFRGDMRVPARVYTSEAMLASGAGRAARADARVPLLEAVGIALTLGASPLLRELRELAGRALIALPAEVDERLAGPEDRQRELVGVMAGTAPVTAGSATPAAADGDADRSELVDALRSALAAGDRDLLDLGQSPTFRRLFPSLTIVAPERLRRRRGRQRGRPRTGGRGGTPGGSG